MSLITETRRADERERASETFLGRDIAEDTTAVINLQAAWLSDRFVVSAAHARVIAEHAFARRAQR